MGPIDCPETSARNYGNTLRHNPEERGSHLLSGGCLKSRILICLYTLSNKIPSAWNFLSPEPHVTSGSGIRKFQADGFLFDRVYQDYALQNRHDAETCALLGHYSASSGFTTTSRRKREITHGWCSEHVLPASSAVREIKCGRFWPCRKKSLLFVDIIYLYV